jgi:hypothetical protein
MMLKPSVNQSIAVELLNKFKERNQELSLPQAVVAYLIGRAERDLFLRVRDGELTLKQFEANVYKRIGCGSYSVLDDFIPLIPKEA